MKNLILICFLLTGLMACNNTPSSNTESNGNTGSQDHPDLVAINDVIHGFYKWYAANMENVSGIDFLIEGKKLTIDNARMDAYFARFAASGFLSQEYIDGEKAQLKNLEATVWAKEEYEDGPVSGLDYDRLTCAQDWDVEFWTKAPISAEGLGTDRATATMAGDEGGSPREQKFDLKKENGKWLIAKIYCDTGVE